MCVYTPTSFDAKASGTAYLQHMQNGGETVQYDLDFR